MERGWQQRQETRFGVGDGPQAEAPSPTGLLVAGFIEEARRLVRAEIGLAREELKHEAKKVQRGSVGIGIGAGLAIGGGLALCAFLVLALATVMAAWLSALIVGVGLCAIGGLIAFAGVKRIKSAEPKKSIEHLQEDRQWLTSTIQAAKTARHSDVRRTPHVSA